MTAWLTIATPARIANRIVPDPSASQVSRPSATLIATKAAAKVPMRSSQRQILAAS